MMMKYADQKDRLQLQTNLDKKFKQMEKTVNK